MRAFRILFFMALCLVGFAAHAEEATYTVKTGDVLSKIREQYPISVNKLAKDNGIVNQNLIYPGQKIVIRTNTPFAASQKPNVAKLTTTAITSASVQVAQSPRFENTEIKDMIVTSKYACIIRPSKSPQCEEKGVLDQNVQVASVSISANSLPYSVTRDTQTKTLIDPPDIDTASAITFSAVKELTPLFANEARTKRRASIRKFLETYLGPPHDLARMEDVLLDTPAPSPSHKLTKGESRD